MTERRCGSAEEERLRRWFQDREANIEATDQEIREWSIVMGHRVRPEQIPELKRRFRDLLDREAHD